MIPQITDKTLVFCPNPRRGTSPLPGSPISPPPLRGARGFEPVVKRVLLKPQAKKI
jgi:hypothetical protein